MTTNNPPKNNLQELISTIQEMCKTSFPNLPEDLVIQILSLEEKFFDDRNEAKNRIEKFVESYLQKGG